MTKPLILIATKNDHKAQELEAIFSTLAAGLPLRAWEEDHQALAEPAETGQDFVANALIKARYYAAAGGLPALADDSGLSVAALGGAPGIFSARYGGPGLTDENRFQLLLSEMAGRHDRRAFFTSVLALARPDGRALWWSGQVHGLIGRAPKGRAGFGYDPVFYYPPFRRTLAELSPLEKNLISHRALAARAFQAEAGRVARFLAASAGAIIGH